MTLKVYRSSAGSGKTFTLAIEYLALALAAPNAFRTILGVTFTNKAANEMKERIIRFLLILADEQHPDTKLQSLLLMRMQEAGHGTVEQVKQKASMVLYHLLQNYGDFSISTIDAFVYRMVRTFSRDVALPTQFELVLESDEIIKRLIDRIFERVGADYTLTNQLLDFLLESMDDRNTHNIEGMIRDFCRELLSERSISYASYLSAIDDETFAKIRDLMRQEYKQSVDELTTLANKAMAILREYGVAPEEMAGGKNGLGGQLKKLAESRDFAVFFDKTSVKKAISEQGALFSAAAYARMPSALVAGLEQIFADIATWYHAKYTRILKLHLLLPSMNTLALTSRIFRETEQLIREEQIVHISEFNKRVAGLLSESGVAFIYERLGERYQHFLLDEFQDTSVLQWSNFLPLIENGLSGGHNSLIVGDAKQAIYRWRNGEVELFVRLPEVFRAEVLPQLTQYAPTLKSHFQLFNLQSNFRSNAEIVDFNNNFFLFVSNKLPEKYRTVYEDCQQQIERKHQAGYVSLSFVEDEDNTLINDIVLKQLVATMRDLFDEGYSPGHIAVLCRRNKECSAVARALTAEGMPIVSSESLQLNSSASVNAVIAAMRILADGHDKLNNASLLAALASQRNDPTMLLEALRPGADLTGLSSFVSASGGLLTGHSLYDLTESIIRTLGLGMPYDPFLQGLLDHILAFQTKEGEGMVAFLRYWEEHLKTTTITLSSAVDAINILTIHKAKGLEFPVVFMPYGELSTQSTLSSRIWVDLDRQFYPPLCSALLRPVKRMLDTPFESAYISEQEKIMLDITNLTYVAFTRAQERLYVFFPLKSIEKSGVTAWVKAYLEHAGIWQDTKLHYTFGRPEQPPAKRELEKANVLEAGAMSNGRRAELFDFPSVSHKDARDFGVRVHEFLSALRYAQEYAPLLKRESALGKFSTDESAQLATIIEALIHQPELKPYFEPPANIRNEAAFTDGKGNLFRVDRYVERNDNATIIEYKTGHPDKAHVDQLKHYVQSVSEIEGKKTHGVLVYLSEQPKIVWV